jgi:hypothetical protein
VGESLDLVALAAEDVHAIPETMLLVRTELLLEARPGSTRRSPGPCRP